MNAFLHSASAFSTFLPQSRVNKGRVGSLTRHPPHLHHRDPRHPGQKRLPGARAPRTQNLAPGLPSARHPPPGSSRRRRAQLLMPGAPAQRPRRQARPSPAALGRGGRFPAESPRLPRERHQPGALAGAPPLLPARSERPPGEGCSGPGSVTPEKARARRSVGTRPPQAPGRALPPGAARPARSCSSPHLPGAAGHWGPRRPARPRSHQRARIRHPHGRSPTSPASADHRGNRN